MYPQKRHTAAIKTITSVFIIVLSSQNYATREISKQTADESLMCDAATEAATCSFPVNVSQQKSLRLPAELFLQEDEGIVTTILPDALRVTTSLADILPATLTISFRLSVRRNTRPVNGGFPSRLTFA